MLIIAEGLDSNKTCYLSSGGPISGRLALVRNPHSVAQTTAFKTFLSPFFACSNISCTIYHSRTFHRTRRSSWQYTELSACNTLSFDGRREKILCDPSSQTTWIDDRTLLIHKSSTPQRIPFQTISAASSDHNQPARHVC